MATETILYPPPIQHYWTVEEYMKYEAESELKHEYIDGVVYDMHPHQRHKWTVEEYLAFESESEIKHEYIDGEIYDMTGGTSNHSEIAANVLGTLFGQLVESDCSLRTSDMRVKIRENTYVYPDLSVVCGEGEYADGRTSLLNPALAVEVTSPSSINYDHSTKLEFYRSLPSIWGYLVIEQNRVYVDLHTRVENGWRRQTFSELNDTIPLETLSASLGLSQIYRGIAFESV